MWLHEPEVPGQHQKDKQRYRQTDTPGQRANDAIAVSLVFDKITQRRTKAKNNGDEKEQRDESHEAAAWEEERTDIIT